MAVWVLTRPDAAVDDDRFLETADFERGLHRRRNPGCSLTSSTTAVLNPANDTRHRIDARIERRYGEGAGFVRHRAK